MSNESSNRHEFAPDKTGHYKDACMLNVGNGMDYYTCHQPRDAAVHQVAQSVAEPPTNLDDRNLACYTPPGSTYPPYISINQRNTMVEITVRSPEGEDRSCGSVAKITMNRFHFHQLINEAKTSLG